MKNQKKFSKDASLKANSETKIEKNEILENKSKKHSLSPSVKLERAARRFGKWLCNLLFPEGLKCTFCGVDILDFENRPFCDSCQKSLPFNNGHRCIVCDQPLGSQADVCDFCQTQHKTFKRLFCPFVYEGVVKNSILAYKDSNQRFRAKAFAKIIVSYIQQQEPDLTFDIVTFIPMTEKKQKQRTFNQSKLLAEEIGKLLQLPVLSLFKKEFDTKSQKKSTFKERRANLMGMYSIKKIKLQPTQKILIVDDVITTCSTVGYCAGLLQPKVKKVYACGIAREYVRQTTHTIRQNTNLFKNLHFPKR